MNHQLLRHLLGQQNLSSQSCLSLSLICGYLSIQSQILIFGCLIYGCS
jgi:hypothetical protein